MSHYRQKSVKELYRPQDIIPTVIGVMCVLAVAVMFANFITTYASV